jgi:hypothetical protein
MGIGTGTDLRIQMFTVTKGHRRHPFVSTIFKVSIVAKGGELPEAEVEDLMRRTAFNPDPSEKKEIDSTIPKILETLIDAQNKNLSAAVGWAYAEDQDHLLEVFWELLRFGNSPGHTLQSVFRYTQVNITLLKSETIPEPPVPFKPCEATFLNRAVGGKAFTSDCLNSSSSRQTAHLNLAK